jgi:hypothetical protein
MQAQGWQKDKEAKITFKSGHEVINLDGKLFTQIIDGKTQSFGEPRIPYFYPIIGPTGAKMTRNYPMVEGVEGESKDHPHHQSLWLAHGNVNGVDFWHDKKARIEAGRTTAIVLHPIDQPKLGPFIKYERTDTWLAPTGDAVLTNKTAYLAGELEDGTRILELRHNLTPAKGVEQAVFGDTKEGAMALRLHPALRLKGEVATGKAINSEGDKDGKVWGKRAKWVAYWGVIDGKTCGVAIFDHPTNLRHPTWWHARDYGLVAANPFGISDFERGKHKRGAGEYTVKQGEQLKLQYRFVFFAGTAEEADIAGKYDQWVEETTKAE